MNIYWAWYDHDSKSGSGVVVAANLAEGFGLCMKAAPASNLEGWNLAEIDTSGPGTYDLEITAD